MNEVDADLDRLLRAAAASKPAALEAPFGFATRVVALWRGRSLTNGQSPRSLRRVFQAVVASAFLVMVCASFGAYWQFSENDELTEPSANAYAIADTTIEAGTWQ